MRILLSALLYLSLAGGLAAQAQTPAPMAAEPSAWAPHAPDRPRPLVVTNAGAVLIPPPADARVLFDGVSAVRWATLDPSREIPDWLVSEGELQVRPGVGSIASRQPFGDIQLHLEWKAPHEVEGQGQERGNSGVLLMGLYEVQILDGYRNDTYADGMAGAIYGQHPPRANPIRRPIEWNSYDIIFHRPRFGPDSALVSPARLTLIWNGVVVHDDQVIMGPTRHGERLPYTAHADLLPIVLEDAGDLVLFRNIWVRLLE
jgi:hypothetical protein